MIKVMCSFQFGSGSNSTLFYLFCFATKHTLKMT